MSKSLKTLIVAVVMAGGVSSVAIADGYDYDYEPVGKSFAAPSVFAWTGFYAGMNAGWIRAQRDSKLTGTTGAFGPPSVTAGLLPSSLSNDQDGFLAGLTLGYNQRMGAAFVAGIEADFAYTDIDGGSTGSITSVIGAGGFTTATATTNLSQEMDWFGTVRARAGWLASQQMLVYVTGGLAYADLEARVSSTLVDAAPPPGPFFASGKSSEWKAGWTVGGGMEWLLGNKTTFKGEYLYYDLDDTSVTLRTVPVGGGTATYKNENTGHIVRMGLNVALY